MIIYVLDHEFESLKLADQIFDTYPQYKKRCFTKASDLLQAARDEKPDMVMICADDTAFSKTIKELFTIGKSIKIIMTSIDKEKAIEAFEIGAQGFILKPITEEKITNQLFKLKHPVLSKCLKEKTELIIK